jgi:uncharacterized repeat protein (TIGR02543 family)
MHPEVKNARRSHLYGPRNFHLPIFSRLKKIALFLSMVLVTSFFVSISVPANAAECVKSSTTVSGETLLTFSTVGTCEWTVPAGVFSARVLVVGGGSSGGSGLAGVYWPQGGSGGAVIDQPSFAISPGVALSVTVGGGGNAMTVQSSSSTSLNNGGQSAFATLSAPGGVAPVTHGGSGGRSGNGNAGGATVGGYSSGGGGGAGGIGVGMTGGAGVNSDISGTSVMYGSGGAGANGNTGSASSGGGSNDNPPSINRGGGGSQPTGSSGAGSAGAAGVVIVRFGAIPEGKSALIFNANGGTGSKSSLLVDTGGSTALPDGTGFTNQGYEFNGWYTNAIGTGGIAYAAGSSITVSSNTNLFAQWSRVPAPNCTAGVGKGGAGTSNFTTTKAGNGCVGISYKLNNVTTVVTFNYTGSDQSWTVPAGVTSATFNLIGAGGGGGIQAGGGGGYATGTYSSLTPGQILTVIVGQGGGGVAATTRPGVSGYPGNYTPVTYGGGGRGGSYGGATANWFASGGGRSAIRLPNATEIATAAGGGGGSYGQCGFGGGGLTGLPTTTSGNSGTGGTQSVGGTGGISNNGYPGTAGVQFQGGDSRDEGGGGGGGYFGGGGGGDNAGGPGGSSYIALLSSASTTAGGNCGAAAVTTSLVNVITYDANNATSGSVPGNSSVTLNGGSLTLATNSGNLAKTNFTFSGWNTAANGSGTTYAVGATTFVPTGDTTLYAQWNSTITYNTNGSTGTAPTAVVTKGSASETFTLNNGAGLSRTGLSFAGWNTAADGSGINYAGGASYTSIGTTTLFAIFRPGYTYNANGATAGTVPATVFGPMPGTQCVTDADFNKCKVFSYTGSDQQFTLPSDIDTSKGILVEAWGAGGGGSIAYYGDPGGGAGGYSKATLATPTSGEVLNIVVGQGGVVRDQTVQYGGGGPGGEGGQVGSSGGGYSGVFTGTTPLIISGAGGGTSPGSAVNGTPGGGGGANQNGGQAGTAAVAGRGGTNSAGGAGATGNTSCPTTGSLSRNGSYLQGGASCNQANAEGGGGGGGGYYGGGGGTYQTSGGGPENGGGGGGSGYLDLTRGTLITATAGGNGVLSNFSYPNISSPNYANNAGRGGKAYTNTVADNTGGNGLITIQWSSTTNTEVVSNNVGNLSRIGYLFAGWNTAADGSGTSVTPGSSFPGSTSATLFATWTPSNTGLTPNFNTNTNAPIGVLGNTAYTINNQYTETNNDLILSQYADKIQIIASVPSGTLKITNTANLILPIGYQGSIATAASTISFIGDLTAVNSALATLSYTAPATPVLTTITITASYAGINGDYRYNPVTGNYYWRGATPVVRQAALDATTAANNCGVSFNGMCGYMTIPNDANESLHIVQKLGIGWIGLSKPTHPTLQYVANAPSGLPTPPFAFWSNGEGGLSNEPNIGIRFTDGKWADLSTQSENPIYEFGGKSENPIFATLTRSIAIAPNVTVTYLANGGTGTVPSPLSGLGGSTLRTALNTGNLAKTGLIFAGWNTKADGTGATYAPNGSFTTLTSLSLHAMYLAACTPTSTTANGYVVLTFTGAGNCLWTTPSGVTSIDLLTVGAGGGGAGNLGGGGGGGQVVYQTGLVPIGNTVVTVGAGGAGGVGQYNVTTNHGKTGVRSGLVSSTLNQVALGGSGGKGRLSASNLNPDGTPINTGWTGGGAAYQDSSAQIIPDPGVGGNSFLGGAGSPNGGGGGGGAGGVGVGAGATSNAGAGGPGVSNSISGTAMNYGGGGGTALYGTNSKWTGLGGIGGGANATATGVGIAGAANTGGGGSSGYTQGGGAGGTGIVILRYAYGTPSAPTITAITPTSGQLSIAFTPPLGDGGAAISNYQYSIDGGTTWVTPSPAQSSSPLVVTGLTNGTTFPVVIRAFNGREGVSSNLVSATTPLSAPTISAVAGNANATITVTAGAGGAPTSYLVTALNNSGVALAGPITCTVTAPNTSCVISGLTNNTAYKFSAVAYKSSLTSPVSNVTSAVTPTSYVITYNANNSTTNTTAEFTTGTPLILPTPVKNGYNFNGWFTASTGGILVGQNGASYSPAATGTLHAQWSGISYAITYNSNGSDGGSAPANGTFTTGSTAYSIAGFSGVLTKSGYTLTGWNTAANGSGIDYGPGLTNTTYSLSANLTLFAKWSYTNFSVTYALNGGTGTLPTSGTKIIGETFTVAAATGLSKSGFSFGGWSDGTNTYRAGSVYTVGSANVTLTARWIALYLITFDKNGATSGSAPSGTTYVAGDTGITLPAVGGMSKSGYIFDGWSTTPTGSLATAPFTTNADVTLYAKWSLANVAITFSAGLAGGVAPTLTALPNATTAAYGSLFTLPTTDTATTTTAGNFVLVGWNDGSSTYRPGDTYRVTAVPPTFTAQWVAIYTVRYSLNGGSSAVPVDATYINNTGITTAAIPVRTGYNFLNWIDQSNETVGANAAYTVRDGHYLLYAVWAPIAYNITFSDNSVAGVTGIPVVQTGNLGEIVSLNSNKPSRAGYLFSNWTTNADGSGLAYGAGSQLILGSADVTLYAQWSAATNTIIYSGTITSGTLPSAQGAATGATAVLAAHSGFARAGYTFDKWSDGIDLYAAGANFTMPAANTLITAQWILNAPNTPAAPTVVVGDASATITVVPGSGNGGPATSYVVTAAPGGATCTVYSPATTCSISGLDNGTAYTFTAVAQNNSGVTAPSAPSNSVIPATKPTLVTSVSAVAGNTNAVVIFTAPSNNGGAEITSYTVTSSPGGFTCVLNAPFTTPLTCTVPGLTNGVAYTFTVRASNGAYISDLSAPSVAVTPKTVPGAPTLSAATSSTTSPGSATVTITPPASNGGDSITSYTITSSPGGFTCTALAPDTSCLVEGLTPGVAYTFTAVARNSVPGTSAASVASNSITPIAKPSAPTNVVAAAGDEEATITFTAPSANGSPITNYKVIALTIDGVPISPEKSCTPAGSATSCTITGLDNERPYTFTVTATNAVDTSFASSASAVTTPKDRFPPNLLIDGPPSGVEIIGNVLSSVAFFEGAPEPVVTYQWQRCTSETDLTTCSAINGATAATYATTSADEGKFIRVVSTATNGVAPNVVAPSPISGEITGPPRATTPTTGTTANIDEPYDLATVAFGGSAPILYAITSGVLPAGLTFDPFTGNISGTPTTVSSATLTISATDQKNQSSSITFTITIVDPNPTVVVNNSTDGADAAARAAAAKAVADAAAKAAADKAAAEAKAKAAADKAAAEAAAKVLADRAAAAAAAKLAADKIAAAQAAQVVADKAAAAAAARIAAANAAQAAAQAAAAKAADLAKAPTVSTAAKQLAAAAAASARVQAAAAVRNAAAAAASEVAAKRAVVAAAKEVTISIGSLNSATATVAKSASADAAAAAAKIGADLAAKASAGEALAAKSAANAAARIAANAVARAAAQQKAAAIAADLAQKRAQELAKVTAEKAAAEKDAQKATTTLALVLEEQVKLSDQLASADTAEERAMVQKLIIEVEKKVDLAQDVVDESLQEASVLAISTEKLEKSSTQAAAVVQIKIKAAVSANKIAEKAKDASEKATADLIVADEVATTAKKVAKTIRKNSPKPVAPPVTVRPARSDALINISGLKSGQKIRVSVKVNIK